MDYNQEKVDEICLALLYLRAHPDGLVMRAWKSMDWEVTDRLFEKGFIHNPKGKSKSVIFTDEGFEKAKMLFEQHFKKKE